MALFLTLDLIHVNTYIYDFRVVLPSRRCLFATVKNIHIGIFLFKNLKHSWFFFTKKKNRKMIIIEISIRNQIEILFHDLFILISFQGFVSHFYISDIYILDSFEDVQYRQVHEINFRAI